MMNAVQRDASNTAGDACRVVMLRQRRLRMDEMGVVGGKSKPWSTGLKHVATTHYH